MVEKEKLHVTLLFLGKISEKNAEELGRKIVGRIEERKAELHGFKKFAVKICGFGSFGGKVLFAKAFALELAQLHSFLSAVSGKIPDPDFVPHITVARKKSIAFPKNGLLGISFSFSAEKFCLFGSAGGKYFALKEFNLC